ncbi:MAG: hypothetical protein LUC94_04800 [Clostridiales bacterium]|nr:hypothetical protein [Clostridiales bacterium]
MKTRLIIDGNSVYEIDEECEACMRRRQSSYREADICPEENTGRGSSRNGKQRNPAWP